MPWLQNEALPSLSFFFGAKESNTSHIIEHFLNTLTSSSRAFEIALSPNHLRNFQTLGMP